MKKNPLVHKGMAVVVLGMGVSGVAAIRYLHALGCRVCVSDTRPETALSAAERQVIAECCKAYEGGGHTERFVLAAELIFKSPGVPGELPVLQKAKNAGIPVLGELALAAPQITCRVVAVTGTNGKTTVATLIGELLREAGHTVSVCGNIGRPLLDCLREEDRVDTLVVEVSSFQLEDAGSFRADIGVILNITPDHLDRHGSLEHYMQAKVRIFANQQKDDVAILCGDDLICLEAAGQLPGKPMLFGHNRDNGCYICESEIYLKYRNSMEKYDLAGSRMDNRIGHLNCAAAIAAARNAGCDRQSIEKGIAGFQPLPHRMEPVDVVDGVQYCNDSKATNTGAVISALQQVQGKVVLIAGGRDKGDDYSLLKNSVKAKVTQVILIGEAAGQIASALQGVVATVYADSLEDAVLRASRVAQRGDTVLLSPACASFDMFNSYGHRGEVFRASVKRLRMNKAADPVREKAR